MSGITSQDAPTRVGQKQHFSRSGIPKGRRTGQAVCLFWREGRCSRGDECQWLHLDKEGPVGGRLGWNALANKRPRNVIDNIHDSRGDLFDWSSEGFPKVTGARRNGSPMKRGRSPCLNISGSPAVGRRPPGQITKKGDECNYLHVHTPRSPDIIGVTTGESTPAPDSSAPGEYRRKRIRRWLSPGTIGGGTKESRGQPFEHKDGIGSHGPQKDLNLREDGLNGERRTELSTVTIEGLNETPGHSFEQKDGEQSQGLQNDLNLLEVHDNCFERKDGGVHTNSFGTHINLFEQVSKDCQGTQTNGHAKAWLDISLVKELSGHAKTVRAIDFCRRSSNLYSAGLDQTLRVWDCTTGGKCTKVIRTGRDVEALLSVGMWLFAGVGNTVKIWDAQMHVLQTLSGPKGVVLSLAVAAPDMLFAGIQDGSILAWKFNTTSNLFEPKASLLSHSGAVVTLMSHGTQLFSGATDNDIKIWDLATYGCIQTLKGHTNTVTRLLNWENFLLSCSLDGTIRVWAVHPQDEGVFKAHYTHPPENCEHVQLAGAITMCGSLDSSGKPVLICSYNDKTVHVYDLPSFLERGRIQTRNEVQVIPVGPQGLVCSGESKGGLKVWRFAEVESANHKLFI